MTDQKFTDDDVIKALECCFGHELCDKCPYEELVDCVRQKEQNAIDLINRQKVEIESLKIANEKMYSANKEQEAEIERLQAVHADMTESLRLAAEANKDMQAELEDLREIVFMDRSEAIKNLKAETIKEFAQRLKRRASMPLGTLYGGMVYLKDIDNIVKIMTEDNNESQNT